MNKNKRYLLAPQMKEYDRMPSAVYPFLMYFQSQNYCSNVVNTDSRGFRITHDYNGNICNLDDKHDDDLALVIGGSAVFGDGATNDASTISSILNRKTNIKWFNFGGRAFNSTQELRLFEFNRHLVKGIKKIVVFSGVNNLVLYYLSNIYLKEYGRIFCWQIFETAADKFLKVRLSAKRRIIKAVLYPVYGNEIDYENVSLKELTSFSFSKTKLIKNKAKLIYRKIENHNIEKDDMLFVLRRDLNMWKIFAEALDIDIYYVLQPMANWVEKELSIEEENIFSELDSNRESISKILNENLDKDLYIWYKNNIEEICRENGIKYFNMNEYLSSIKLDNKWLFVDRVHMTDEGYNVIAEAFRKEGIC